MRQYISFLFRVALFTLSAMSFYSSAHAALIKIEFTEPTGTVIGAGNSWVVLRAKVTNISGMTLNLTQAYFPYNMSQTNIDGPGQYEGYRGGGIGLYFSSWMNDYLGQIVDITSFAPGASYETEWDRLIPSGIASPGVYKITSALLAKGYTVADGFVDPIYVSNTFEWTVLGSPASVPLPEPTAPSLIFLGILGLMLTRRRGT